MDIPTFDASTLSSLSKRIEANLKKPANRDTKPITKGKSRTDTRAVKDKQKVVIHQNGVQLKGTKRSRNGEAKEVDTEKDNGSEQRAKDTKGSLKVNKTTIKGSSHHSNTPAIQGNEKKKAPRKLGGKDSLKARSNSGPSIKGVKLSTSKQINGLTKDSKLEDEFKALGGTEEDFELIGTAGSESEVEGHASGDIGPKLGQDLQKLINQLGIQKVGASEKDRADEMEEETAVIGQEEHIPIEINLPPQKGPVKVAKEASKGKKNTSVILIFEPRSDWHATQLPPLPTSSHSLVDLNQDTIHQIHQHAKELLEKENKNYVLRNGASSSAHQFYSTIMSSGTLSDKISALTLSVQESPLHNMKALENLVALAKKRSRGQAVEVLGALKDLFGAGNILPSDRKLRAFAMQPGLSAVLEDLPQKWELENSLPTSLKTISLVSWAYEDWLKKLYFDVLKIIETWCNDEIVFARVKVVDYVYELLRDKPEQEANLLRLLVNKLGDCDKKIAAKTSYNILQIETSHPLMKPIIVSAIESDLLFRPGQSIHAKYYAAITLNQTVLSGKEEDVAKKLLNIYFTLFVTLLSKPEPVKTKLPDANVVTLNKKGERQGGGGAAGKKAQKKLAEQAKNTTVDDEIREKMLSAVLTGVNRAIPYTTTDDESFERHLDTLFRVTHSSNFNTSVQALMLIQQLCGIQQAASDRFYRTLYESLLDPRLLTSSKQAMYLNLLFKSLRTDLNVKRVQAFAKRLLQIVAMHQASFACGVFYLLRELEGVFSNLQAFIDQPEEDESDDEEFHDVDENEVENQAVPLPAIQSLRRRPVQLYNGRKREPEYSNAEKSCLWELDPFLLHFHPSVSLFASRLLTHKHMPPKPDLSTHTLIHFLDRFVYRNPKKSAAGTKGTSIMQPLAGGDASGLQVSARSARSALRAPVNTEAFWKMEGAKVEADEVFFHKYFNNMGKGKEQAKKKKVDKKKGAEGSDSEEEDEDEEEIWKALVDSRPEIEGSDQSDADLDMDDLESAIGDSDDDLAVEEAGDGKEQNIPDADLSDDDDDVAMDFGEDNDALLGSDDEIASDLDEAFKAEMQLGSSAKIDASSPGQEEESKRGKKRRRLKNLPTFASVDDYAAMLGGEDDEDDAGMGMGR